MNLHVLSYLTRRQRKAALARGLFVSTSDALCKGRGGTGSSPRAVLRTILSQASHQNGPLMHPTAAERDALFESFARALFKHDMDALCRVVSPEFVWRYHDRWGFAGSCTY